VLITRGHSGGNLRDRQRSVAVNKVKAAPKAARGPRNSAPQAAYCAACSGQSNHNYITNKGWGHCKICQPVKERFRWAIAPSIPSVAGEQNSSAEPVAGHVSVCHVCRQPCVNTSTAVLSIPASTFFGIAFPPRSHARGFHADTAPFVHQCRWKTMCNCHSCCSPECGHWCGSGPPARGSHPCQ
jgi:hypothetical protein